MAVFGDLQQHGAGFVFRRVRHRGHLFSAACHLYEDQIEQ
jgi:hypothetical protein